MSGHDAHASSSGIMVGFMVGLANFTHPRNAETRCLGGFQVTHLAEKEGFTTLFKSIT